MSDRPASVPAIVRQQWVSVSVLVMFTCIGLAGWATETEAPQATGMYGALITAVVIGGRVWMRRAGREPETARFARHCRGCGYGLSGLSESGVCPECGLDFPPFWANRSLDASDILWRVGWPLAAIVLFVMVNSVESLLNRSGSSMGLLGIVMFGAGAAINTPLQVAMLARRHASPGREWGGFVEHLDPAERLAVVIVVIIGFIPTALALTCAGGLVIYALGP
jgi:hypothetical protein